jgi:hypothetical protein
MMKPKLRLAAYHRQGDPERPWAASGFGECARELEAAKGRQKPPFVIGLVADATHVSINSMLSTGPLPFAIDGGLARAEAFLDLLGGSDVANGQCSA